MTRFEVLTYVAQIYVGGEAKEAARICRDYCDKVGLCVTIEPVEYVFTGGDCTGVRVGLINYGPHPAEPRVIWNKAEKLAMLLIEGLGQQTATIVATDKTITLDPMNTRSSAAITRADGGAS